MNHAKNHRGIKHTKSSTFTQSRFQSQMQGLFKRIGIIEDVSFRDSSQGILASQAAVKDHSFCHRIYDIAKVKEG
jgi:hypothetical protein